ncbi:MAG: hypothetical protein KJI70_02260 [Patescibacteria group bacterium]|nr:hypothetical protein [Patescibacteria group bacterium]
MTKTKQKTIKISKSEYQRLKFLDLEFSKLIRYFRYLQSLDEAREQIKEGKTFSLKNVLEEYRI